MSDKNVMNSQQYKHPPGHARPSFLPPGDAGGANFFGFGGHGQDGSVDHNRQERIRSIRPYMDMIKNRQVPTGLTGEQMQNIMKDLKEEGNQLFKEKDYFVSGEHYTCALILAHMLQTDYLMELDYKFVSSLFSNRAFCCLKLDNFKTAVEDCDLALNMNGENLKAYFRKASAQKSLKLYELALNAAECGERKAANLEKKEVQDFQTLIREIRSHLPSNQNHQSKTKSTDVKEVVNSKPTANRSWADMSVSQDETCIAKSTEILTDSKQNGTKAKKKKKKRKKKKKSTQYQGRFANLQSGTDSSGDTSNPSVMTTSGDDSENEQTTERRKVSIAQNQPRYSSDTQYGIAADFLSVSKKKILQTNSSMGLDDFENVQDHRPTSAPGASGIQAGVKPKLTKKQATDFTPINNPQLIPDIFRFHYDHALVCSKCFPRENEGYGNFIVKAALSHQCERNILVVRPKGEKSWSKVRQRTQHAQVEFKGQYKLCQQFSSGVACKVPEERCCFCHNNEEIYLWGLEQKGLLDIQNFSAQLKTYVEGFKCHGGDGAATVPSDNVNTNMPGYPPARPALLPHPVQPPPMYPTRPSVMHQPETMPSHPPKLLHLNIPKREQTQNQMNIKDIIPPQQQIDFPLHSSHVFKLVCNSCLSPASQLNYYNVNKATHSCIENILVVREKTEELWVKIRERKNHRPFLGQYQMCNSFASRRSCSHEGDTCSFAHSFDEQNLWTLEKDGHFNIQEFILKHRSDKRRGFSLSELLKKHPGEFIFLCRVCFYGRPARLSVEVPPGGFCSMGHGPFEINKLMMHFSSPQCRVEPIQDRPFQERPDAFYMLCHKRDFCLRRRQGQCYFAHSMVERDVWLVERDQRCTRIYMVDKSRLYMQSLQQPEQVGSHQPSHSSSSQSTKEPLASPPPPVAFTKCPFRIVDICGLCWKKGTKSACDGTKDRCNGKGMGHIWSQNKTCLRVPGNKLIRPLPHRLPNNCNFIICKHVRAGKKCDYTLGGACQFAHSKEEIEVWTWMVNKKIQSLGQLVEASVQTCAAQVAKANPIEEGKSVVAVQPAAPRPNPLITPADLPRQSMLYCHYCSTHCNTQRQWEQHCASANHSFNVNSDKEHQWNYRQPPWAAADGKYSLCEKHVQRKCRYSNVPDMYNLCELAHCREELDEWRERWEWRLLKREMAKQECLYSYMDQLLDEYQEAASGLTVLSSEVDFVDLICSKELNQYFQSKQSIHHWKFELKTMTGMRLEHVALLHDKDRLHFSLVAEDIDPPYQLASGDSFNLTEKLGSHIYEVGVKFQGNMFGSFTQTIAFDFGMRPVLTQKFVVEVGTHFVQEKVKNLREKLKFFR